MSPSATRSTVVNRPMWQLMPTTASLTTADCPTRVDRRSTDPSITAFSSTTQFASTTELTICAPAFTVADGSTHDSSSIEDFSSTRSPRTRGSSGAFGSRFASRSRFAVRYRRGVPMSIQYRFETKAKTDTPDWGNVAVGQRADLLLVDGDPTRDVAALSAIRAVLQDGVPIARTPVEN